MTTVASALHVRPDVDGGLNLLGSRDVHTRLDSVSNMELGIILQGFLYILALRNLKALGRLGLERGILADILVP